MDPVRYLDEVGERAAAVPVALERVAVHAAAVPPVAVHDHRQVPGHPRWPLRQQSLVLVRRNGGERLCLSRVPPQEAKKERSRQPQEQTQEKSEHRQRVEARGLCLRQQPVHPDLQTATQLTAAG